MERLTAQEIKKTLYGVTLSDGGVYRGRFSLYSSKEEFANHLYDVLSQITGAEPIIRKRVHKKGYIGWDVYTKTHPYFKSLQKHIYGQRKELNKYNVSRLDARALAYMYMCDGYTEHAKNRKTNKVQNIGWFCLEAFPKEELELLQNHLDKQWGIKTSLVKKPWGFGYRMRIGGENLQKFISLIYPFVLDCFLYKTILFYKGKEYVQDLPSAEHFIVHYNEVDDIVRHPLKSGKT